jgi:nicotinate-nucleotide adenylyltransferase
MRYGIYGGAFDPIHWGHLLLAESCLREAKLDRVIFVPTGISPHRHFKNSYSATTQDRYNMVALAIDNYNKFEVSRAEIDRHTVSYTVDTLRYFRDEFNGGELFLIMGCDTFCDFPKWHDVNEILQLAVPLVALRNGSSLPKTNINYIHVNMPIIDISSTTIRNMLANNITPKFQTTEKVLNYIENHKLYK